MSFVCTCLILPGRLKIHAPVMKSSAGLFWFRLDWWIAHTITFCFTNCSIVHTQRSKALWQSRFHHHGFNYQRHEISINVIGQTISVGSNDFAIRTRYDSLVANIDCSWLFFLHLIFVFEFCDEAIMSDILFSLSYFSIIDLNFIYVRVGWILRIDIL